MAKRKGAPVTNEIGVNFKFDAKEKVLSGKMMFFEVKTDLADERELYEAIEKAINEVLKARM
ncbi:MULTISPECIES: hypothetical protein [Alkalispirochaeta]|nr:MULTISPECIES: hypothetical protein [Alkalispirochaeta]